MQLKKSGKGQTNDVDEIESTRLTGVVLYFVLERMPEEIKGE